MKTISFKILTMKMTLIIGENRVDWEKMIQIDDVYNEKKEEKIPISSAYSIDMWYLRKDFILDFSTRNSCVAIEKKILEFLLFIPILSLSSILLHCPLDLQCLRHRIFWNDFDFVCVLVHSSNPDSNKFLSLSLSCFHRRIQYFDMFHDVPFACILSFSSSSSLCFSFSLIFLFSLAFNDSFFRWIKFVSESIFSPKTKTRQEKLAEWMSHCSWLMVTDGCLLLTTKWFRSKHISPPNLSSISSSLCR